jgi:hypothetical protein
MATEYIIFAVCGVLGVVFHSICKYISLKGDAKAANYGPLTLKEYISTDIAPIALAFCSVAIWLLLFGEAASKYPKLEDFARASFVAMGAIGSYVIQLGLSTLQAKIKKVVDIKTNIADNVTNKPE